MCVFNLTNHSGNHSELIKYAVVYSEVLPRLTACYYIKSNQGVSSSIRYFK